MLLGPWARAFVPPEVIGCLGNFIDVAKLFASAGGRERTETEHGALLAAAGFQITKIVPTQSEMSVEECVPLNP